MTEDKNAKKPHYVNSKLFKQQLVEYYETGANLERRNKVDKALNFIKYMCEY